MVYKGLEMKIKNIRGPLSRKPIHVGVDDTNAFMA